MASTTKALPARVVVDALRRCTATAKAQSCNDETESPARGSAGSLTTLNLNEWNLACPFPAAQIGQLEFVENLVMPNNLNLTVRCLQFMHCSVQVLVVRNPQGPDDANSRIFPC